MHLNHNQVRYGFLLRRVRRGGVSVLIFDIDFMIHRMPDSLSVNPTVAGSRPPSRAMQTDGIEGVTA